MTTANHSEIGLPEDVIDEIRRLASDGERITRAEDLPEGTRQILMVSGHSLITANFVASQPSGKIDSSAVLLLTGNASPSSHPNLKRAYVTFVDDAAPIRSPAYSEAQGTIWLTMRFRNLPMVLSQVHEPNVYCWIGRFAQGHLYGDIHTAH